MANISCVHDAPVLQELSGPEVEQLGAIAEERIVHKGDRLITHGEKADSFFIGRAGQFTLTFALRMLGESRDVAIDELGALHCFGWSALVPPHIAMYSVYCIADGSVMAFPGDALLQLLERNDHMGNHFFSKLTEVIGGRLRSLRSLWSEEVEESSFRVQRWADTEITHRFFRAMREAHSNPVVHH